MSNIATQPLYIHQHTIPFGHGDMAGIVYTPRFSDYCMETSEAWLKDIIGVDWYEINKAGIYSTPVMHYSIDFKSPLYPGNKLNTHVLLTKVGRSSFSLSLLGKVQEDTKLRDAFQATMVMSFVDMKQMASIEIPAEFLQKMQNYQQAHSTLTEELVTE